MAQDLTQADMSEILSAFERSDFARLDLAIGSVRLAVSRSAVTDASVNDENVIDLPADAVVVSAPLLGFFQSSDGGGAAALVGPGSQVQADSTIGFIRVMQKRVPVKAGKNGKVVRVLVEDRQLVEYGQPLLQILPAGGAEE